MRNLILTVFIVLSSVNIALSIAPVVTSISPQRQILNAPRSVNIIADFNTPLDPASVNSLTFRVFGKQTGPAAGTIELLNGNTRISFIPSTPFLAGEWITVNLSKGIKSADNTPMALGYNWNFWTIAQPGTLNQTLIRTLPVRREGEGLIQCYGALGCDFNNDGRTDLAVVNEVSRDFRVFLNNGISYDSIFAVYPLPSGSFPSPSEAADFNHDGIVDIVIGNAANNVMSLFLGLGNAAFMPEAPYTASNNVRGVAVADFDGDGFDDVITANRGGSNISLFKNNGNGTFGSAFNINTVGNSETAVMIADANNDGIQDAFIGCYQSNEIVLLLGDGNGGFNFSSRSSLNGPPWAIVVGDINGDGNVDVAACLSSANRIGIIFGDGAGGLGTVTNYLSGSFPLAIDIGDVDGDNDLDIISSQYAGADFRVFENLGNGVLSTTPIILPSSGSGSCITVHDRDNDGDLDLAGIDEVDDLLFIYNNGPGPLGINSSGEIPDGFYLEQNYPNPFNPVTNLKFGVSEMGFVSLKVFDASGKVIAILLNESRSAGIYSVTFDGSELASGIYYYQLIAGDFMETKSMLLLK
ncbi:MAG TPA: FG-GAP-like repeat-containing protein [Ignavibacteria bacterium]|nr:FG-GAP-like repeat-containing protein [Ignavibacteria bacterium]